MVQDLSAQLQANQDETGRLRRLVEALEAPIESSDEGDDDDDGNADLQNGGHEESDRKAMRRLRRAYDRVLRENLVLTETNADLSLLCAEYEIALEKVAGQVRDAAFTSRTKETELMRRTADKLDVAETRILQVEHEKGVMHRQLTTVADLLRKAYAAQHEHDVEVENASLRLEIAALKEELGFSKDEVMDGPRVDEDLAKYAPQTNDAGDSGGGGDRAAIPIAASLQL